MFLAEGRASTHSSAHGKQQKAELQTSGKSKGWLAGNAHYVLIFFSSPSHGSMQRQFKRAAMLKTMVGL
jgi:hypothetical protein